LTVFALQTASAQVVEYVRPLSDIAHLLSIRQERNLERSLGELFPVHTLNHTAHGTGKILAEHITYDVIKQRGVKYSVVIFTGSWKTEASQLAIYRLEAGGYPSPVYHSRNWRSNYSDSYHEIQSMALGKENVVLIKEGENGKSPFVIASAFNFREKKADENTKGYFTINDLTPHLPRLRALVDFPLKTLYGQAVKLQKMSDHLLLQAADVEFSWDRSNAPKALEFWKYDKFSRKFIIATSVSAIPVMTKVSR
jgi:hypothetical protein